MIQEYKFKNGVVFIVDHKNKYCETQLLNNKRIPAIPTDDQLELAISLGYSNTWDLCVAHEFLHNFLAAEKGLPHSTVMHHVANNLGHATDATRYEEAEVLMVQKAINELKKIDRNEYDFMSNENLY